MLSTITSMLQSFLDPKPTAAADSSYANTSPNQKDWRLRTNHSCHHQKVGNDLKVCAMCMVCVGYRVLVVGGLVYTPSKFSFTQSTPDIINHASRATTMDRLIKGMRGQGQETGFN